MDGVSTLSICTLLQMIKVLRFENDMLREELRRARDPARQGDKT